MTGFWRASSAALLLLAPLVNAQAPRAPRSGFDDMGPSTQALQRDDQLNPGFLWVKDGAIGPDSKDFVQKYVDTFAAWVKKQVG